MLTLRELTKMIQTPEKNEKIPTDKLLKERKIPVVVSKKIGNGERMALVAVYPVYQNGYTGSDCELRLCYFESISWMRKEILLLAICYMKRLVNGKRYNLKRLKNIICLILI